MIVGTVVVIRVGPVSIAYLLIVVVVGRTRTVSVLLLLTIVHVIRTGAIADGTLICDRTWTVPVLLLLVVVVVVVIGGRRAVRRANFRTHGR